MIRSAKNAELGWTTATRSQPTYALTVTAFINLKILKNQTPNLINSLLTCKALTLNILIVLKVMVMLKKWNKKT